MAMLRISLLFVFIAVYAEASTSRDGPMVAFMCNKPAMFFSEETGEWQEDHSTDCITDPVKILDYCRAKFPEHQVTNVVQASERVTISNWCGFDKTRCHKHNTHEVTPFRCLVGAFQSDALLVPEHCLFDHKHGDMCTEYARWNVTALGACNSRDMRLESFAILQPCGINKFNGVEFVCCPKRVAVTTALPTTTTTTTTTTTELPSSSFMPKLEEIPDKNSKDADDDEDFFAHYLQKSYDERYMNEHNYFMKAKTDLQKHHHERVTKMMKEWAAARQRVQDMNDVDPKGAEKLNREITARFQKTYEALEEEGMAEKKQLQALHQQRVQSDLNDKKRHAMEHYMDALTTHETDAAYILKALKRYIKAEEKDRLHTVNHYKHEVDTDPKEALTLRPQTLNHLHIIEQRVQQAIDMLNRVPQLQKKILAQIDAYLKTFHEIDVAISDVLVDQVAAPVEEEADTEEKDVNQEPPKVEGDWAADGDYEEYYDEDDEYDDELSDEDYDADEEDPDEAGEDEDHKPESEVQVIGATQMRPTDWDDEIDEDEHDLTVPEVMPAHLSANKLQVNVQEKKGVDQAAGTKAVNALYQGYTLGIAVAAIAVFVILVAGIVLLRRKNSPRQTTTPGNHGFVEIDPSAASPEERHVANMQMNGYENPTYKYFESNA